MAQRRADQHQAHAWEFPGGKVEPDETIAQALKRELLEEVGIVVTSHSPLIDVCYDYPDKKVQLCVHQVIEFEGQAIGLENQLLQWVAMTELKERRVPLANEAIVEHLQAKIA